MGIRVCQSSSNSILNELFLSIKQYNKCGEWIRTIFYRLDVVRLCNQVLDVLSE